MHTLHTMRTKYTRHTHTIHSLDTPCTLPAHTQRDQVYAHFTYNAHKIHTHNTLTRHTMHAACSRTEARSTHTIHYAHTVTTLDTINDTLFTLYTNYTHIIHRPTTFLVTWFSVCPQMFEVDSLSLSPWQQRRWGVEEDGADKRTACCRGNRRESPTKDSLNTKANNQIQHCLFINKYAFHNTIYVFVFRV